MRINRLSLTNFRSFGQRQSIDFAPITLLFGPNSAGKSSISMAFAYLYEILSNNNCDPTNLELLGGKSVGGFQSLVHDHDLSRIITIRMDCSGDFDKYYEPDFFHFVDKNGSKLGFDVPEVDSIVECLVDQYSFEIEIAWSNSRRLAYVKTLRVWLAHEYVGQVSYDVNTGKAWIIELNGFHKVLECRSKDGIKRKNDYEARIRNGVPIAPQTDFELSLHRLNPHRDGPITTSDFSRAGHQFVNSIAPIELHMTNSSILSAVRDLRCVFITPDYPDELEGKALWEFHTARYANHVLNKMFATPISLVLDKLSESAFIGPLRSIRSSSVAGHKIGWFDGAEAWSVLKERNDVLSKANYWLYSKERLNTGFSIISDSLNSYIEKVKIDSPVIGKFSGLLNEKFLLFKKGDSETYSHLEELGTGMSQLVPILTAALTVRGGFVSVEQPELHLHPALQLELADVFVSLSQEVNWSERVMRINQTMKGANFEPQSSDRVDTIDSKVGQAVELALFGMDDSDVANRNHHPDFLIETHSEHLILRLLRRVRETAENSTEPHNFPIQPSHISVIYIEQVNGNAKVNKIDINEEGDFVQRWPKGFFGERSGELF